MGNAKDNLLAFLEDQCRGCKSVDVQPASVNAVLRLLGNAPIRVPNNATAITLKTSQWLPLLRKARLGEKASVSANNRTRVKRAPSSAQPHAFKSMKSEPFCSVCGRGKTDPVHT
jgi:hypothetical protein